MQRSAWWLGMAIVANALAEPNLVQAAENARAFSGPVDATVVRVIDGDTFEASAAIWLGQRIDVRVRIAGIDAPETRARCDSERNRAEAARDFLSHRIAGGEVKLTQVRYDKYGGRVDAVVVDGRGDIGEQMIRSGLARPYGGGHRAGWCGTD